MFSNLKKAYLKKHPNDNKICKKCQEKDIKLTKLRLKVKELEAELRKMES